MVMYGESWRGATIIDESMFWRGLCHEHIANYGKISIPCSSLEFLYDGLRQIVIKEGAK
jgi:hypothetical protein